MTTGSSRNGWLLVPTESHVEAFARDGRRALSLRRVVNEGARRELTGLEATTPEATRLLVGKLRDVAPLHARALDQVVGSLRRAGTKRATLEALGLPRARYFAELLGDLDALLARRSLYDDRSSAWVAARGLLRENGDRAAGGPVLARGLSRWDPSTLAYLEALDARARRDGHEGLTIELPVFEDGPLREASDGLASELEARWAERPNAPALSFVNALPLSADRTTLIEAHAAESEARAVARTVVEAVARGVALDRIAIVPVDLEEAFLEPLRFELGRAGLPFAEPRGRPAIASPRAHAAIELLRLARGPLARDTLVDLLRVPDLRLKRWFGEERRLVSELLHELAELPMRHDRSGGDLALELDDHLAELEREDPASATRLGGVRRGLDTCFEELRALSEAAPRAALLQRALALFDGLGLLSISPDALGRALEHAKQGRPELLQALGHDAGGARALKTALERLAAAAHRVGVESDPISMARLLEELELALEGVSPTGGAVRAGVIRIARPSDVAGLEFDTLVLCRASDRGLDAQGGNELGLGRDVEARLPAFERPLGHATEQRFTLLAVAWALKGARRVTVTWSSHDVNRTLGPSRFVRHLGKSIATRREPASPLVPAARPATPPPPLTPGARARIQTEKRHIAFYADPNAAFDEYNGSVGPLGRFVPATRERPLAVTALEKTLRCPFLGFTSSVLRAVVADPVEDAISARERGNLLHAALATALESVQELWGLRSSRELEQIALERARVFLEQRGRSPLRRAGLSNTLLDVAALLRFIFAEDSPYRFALAEQEFGGREGWSPLEIGGRYVRGRADRIDLSPDGTRVRVVDYKTRMPTKAEQERALQPALYARKAALELSAQTVEFSYLALQGRAPQERSVFADKPDAEPVQLGVERALAALESFEAGVVPARPASSAYCPRCAARDVCRRPLSAPESNET